MLSILSKSLTPYSSVFKDFSIPKIVSFKNLLTNRFKIISIKNNLLVHFISVGQGDAMAINLPNGKVMLIDTGSKNTNISYTTYLQDKVINNSHTKNIYLFDCL